MKSDYYVNIQLMSAEMTVAEMNAEGIPPPEEPPKQEKSQKAEKKKTWICSQCGDEIEWLPPAVRHLHPSKIRCLKCQKAKSGAEASADAPPPAPEAPRHAAPQRRPAGAMHRAQAPRALTLEVVELCAFRSGLAPPQVEALLATIRSHMTPSSDK